MKKRKILYLFPLAALILSGCTFQEGWESVKGFATDSVYEPVKGFFENLFGKKTENKEEKKDEQQKPDPGVAGDDPGDEVPDTEVGSLEHPLSIAEFQAQVDQLIDYANVEEGKYTVDTSHLFYLKAKVKSNSAASEQYRDVNYLNLIDGNLEVTGYFVVLGSTIDAKYNAENSMVGNEVIVKGYGALMKKAKNNVVSKVYEIMKKDNDHKATVMQVIEPELDPKYGTPENPLTVSEAKALIDEEKPTPATIYVTGTVSSNTAYSSQFKNLDIIISDGTNSLKIFRCGTFPATDDITAVTQNSLKGRTVVAKGTGDYYADNSEYEITSPTVLSITGEGPAVVTIDNYGTAESPLTVSEAIDVINLEDPTKETLYVTGKVVSNGAWSTQYKNLDIVITDGEKEFTVFRATTFPDGFDATKVTADSLKNKVVVASGTGTLYGSTYEFNSGCTVISIEDAAPTLVSSISFGEIADPIEMELGKASAQFQLTPTVLPADATDKTVTWSTGNANVATVSDGLITAVGEGTTTITATAHDGSGKTATANVHVTQPATPVELSSIEISGTAKSAYLEDEAYTAEGLSVTAHYSDNSSDTVAAPEWSFEVDGEAVTTAALEHNEKTLVITASYGGETDTKEVALTVTFEKGTEKHPYTGEEAAAVAATLANSTQNDKHPTEDSYYIKGVVTKFNETFNASFGNYSFTIDGGFVGWRLKNGSQFASFNDGDLELGDTVTMYVQIMNYGGTPESSGGYITAIQKCTVQTVVVSGTLTTSEYGIDTNYSHSGLVATATTDTGSFDVSSFATWTPSKATAEDGDKSITWTATYHNVSSEAYEVSVTVAGQAKVYSKTSSIALNDKIAFVCEDAEQYLNGISTGSSKYGTGTDIPAKFTESAFPLTVVEGSSEGTFAFQLSDKSYLHWSGSSNTLDTNATLDANTSWNVSFDTDGNAVILNSATPARQVWWNVSNPRFACYTGKTAGASYYAIQLYKLA